MKKSVVVLLHMAYWALYSFLIVFILFCLSMGMEHLPIRSTFLTIIPAILGFYAFYYSLFDKYLAQKQILKLFLFGVIAAVIAGIIGGITMEGLAHLNFGKSLFNDGWASATAITQLLAFVAFLNGGMGLLLRSFITWYEELQNKLELQKKTSM
jgi:two-component system, LytTR family, sensor kinase